MTVAMKDCANYEIVLELGADIPHIVRTEAMQIGRLTRRLEPSVASSPDAREGSQDSDVVSSVQQDAKEGEPAGKGSLPVEAQTVLMVLWTALSILLILAPIYLTFRGHFQ